MPKTLVGPKDSSPPPKLWAGAPHSCCKYHYKHILCIINSSWISNHKMIVLFCCCQRLSRPGCWWERNIRGAHSLFTRDRCEHCTAGCCLEGTNIWIFSCCEVMQSCGAFIWGLFVSLFNQHGKNDSTATSTRMKYSTFCSYKRHLFDRWVTSQILFYCDLLQKKRRV